MFLRDFCGQLYDIEIAKTKFDKSIFTGVQNIKIDAKRI
jgi:hypothetical protein